MTFSKPITLLGFALLGLLAVAGWTRTQASADSSKAAVIPAVTPAVETAPMPVATPGNALASEQTAAPAAQTVQYREPRAQRTTTYVRDDRRYGKAPRSKAGSVGIVAGSAGAGAAIGAIAGGGKGAGIGAIAGGIGGLIYDRATHDNPRRKSW